MKTGTDLSGRILRGDLKLVSLLGSGAMGQVYRAQHLNLDKQVAIKIIRAQPPPTQRQIARFRTEARATSRLEHPNCIQLLDFGEDPQDGLLFLVMEMLEGVELTKLLSREHILIDQRCARIVMQVLAAVASAHDIGIVHRDIKPGNIILVSRMGDEGLIPEFVKVCDFGIAKLIQGDKNEEPLTLEGTSLGTPAFAAPEQLMGAEIDGRADIYACGVLMYRMLTGCLPFTGEPMEVAMAQVSVQPKPVAEHRPGLDPRLIAVVERAMSKRPDERFQTAREMRNALKPIVGMSSNVPTGEFFPMPSTTSSAPPPPFSGPATPSSTPPRPPLSSAPPPPFSGPATPSSAPPRPPLSSAPPPPFSGPATPSSAPPRPPLFSAPPPPFSGPATPSSAPPRPPLFSAPPPPFSGPATPSSTPPPPPFSGPATPSSSPPLSSAPPPPFSGPATPSSSPPLSSAPPPPFSGPGTPPGRTANSGELRRPDQRDAFPPRQVPQSPPGAMRFPAQEAAQASLRKADAPKSVDALTVEPMMDLEFDEPEPYVP